MLNKQSDAITKQIQEIQKCIYENLAKFDKCENQKTIENDISKEVKKWKQLLNLMKDQKLIEIFKKIIIEKEQKIKYLIQIKKNINKPELRGKYLQKLKTNMKNINEKIQSFRQNKQKKKKATYDKNIEFLKYQLVKLQKIKQILESSKLFSVQNMEKLFNHYLSDMFSSFEDLIFQSELEQLYNSIILFSNVKESELDLFSESKLQKPIKFDPKDFKTMINLSYENQLKINDYCPSKETKQKHFSNSIFPEYKMIDLTTISKMSLETIFLIFYLQKNTMQQYFAAKQLKSKDWRFYAKSSNWFKRYEPPSIETHEYEKGTYLYFDYEKFCTKKKSDFTMKYAHLEKSI